MERHERYDPEDIEHLLSERSFDELLQEERAYVLRHLSGREEYETMRSLLQHMRNEGDERLAIEPDEQVRETVMAAFRAQQRPQWRIWLNTVVAQFQVREAHGFWRPALAFGSVAILLGLGVWFATTMAPGASEQVAEVKSVTKELEQVIVAPKPVEMTGEINEPSGSEALSDQGAAEATEAPRSVITEATRSQREADLSEDVRSGTHDSALANDVVVGGEKMEVAEVAAMEDERLEMDAIRSVGLEELSRNQSAANVTGTAAAGARSAAKRITAVPDQARPMDADPEVWAFLTNGW